MRLRSPRLDVTGTESGTCQALTATRVATPTAPWGMLSETSKLSENGEPALTQNVSILVLRRSFANARITSASIESIIPGLIS